jgi:hypothetical protein
MFILIQDKVLHLVLEENKVYRNHRGESCPNRFIEEFMDVIILMIYKLANLSLIENLI